jgi:hypothetical protein
MSNKNRKRRADGSLRPAWRRYKIKRNARRRGEREAAMTPEQKSEREAWLANFDMKERAKFFADVNLGKCVFLRAFSRELDLPQEEAWPLLERLADERNWMKLKTKDGMVVGAGPLRLGKKKRPKIHVPEREEAA